MTRDEIIAANARLRTCFSDGRVEVCHGPYEIDDRMMGRMLCALAKYDNFPTDSLLDEGLLIFAGFGLAWKIQIVDGDRVMRVWINGDGLRGA